MASALQLKLFGSPQISYQGQPLTGFVSAKVRALLIYLAVTGRPHSRDHLAELLWADTPASTRTNLRKALSNLRQLIGDLLVEDAKESIALNGEQVWVDVVEFGRLSQQSSAQEASALYQADFLTGFNLSLSYEFEAWALSEQSRLKSQIVEIVRSLATQHTSTSLNAGSTRNTFSQAISTVRRLLDLEPWHEENHRWLMELLAKDGQRSAALAHFEVCKRVLWDELAVEPSAETLSLYKELVEGERFGGKSRPEGQPTDGSRRGEVDDGANRIRSKAISTFRQELPDFLRNQLPALVQPSTFVAREAELAHLDRQLTQVLAGQGLVSFVIGEAGSGKTILLREFVQQALEKEGNLVIASGNCNAYGGLGDPYLPFREIMALLTGDIEARWRAGVISHDLASRLWKLLPIITQALIQHGTSLLEIFLSGEALYERLSQSISGEPPWLLQLHTLVTQSNTKQKSVPMDQSAVFEMYTKVLQAVAQHAPLILLLEDLHWTDSGTISLLFHLGRRLAGQRIWVIGTYRPHDIAAKRTANHSSEAERHPVEMLVHEFQQLFGEQPLDLGKSDGQHFVESILNHEKHRLPVAFRSSLFRHTQGHALFTAEILRGLQHRQVLLRDEDGYWVIGKGIDWTQLPTRVEGVIKERIDRLPTQLLELVKVASVMGEEFIGEVVARVLRQDERTIVRQLGMLLDRQHDLVQSQSNTRLGEQRISHYRFRHILFQHYLYQSIDEAERSYLHEDIGNLLEQFYQEQATLVAVQLAYHFRAAGLTHKAVDYLQQAAKQAIVRYAYQEAVAFYAEALSLITPLSTTPIYTKLATTLQLALADCQAKAGQIAQALHSFQQAADLARSLGLFEELANAAIGYEQVRYRFNQPAEPAIRLLENAIGLIGDIESPTKVRLLGQLAQALFFAGESEQAKTLSRQAVALARRIHDDITLFDALYVPTMALRTPDGIQERLADLDELLSLARKLSDPFREVHVYAVSVIDNLGFGRIAVVDEILARHAKLSEELQQPFLLFVSRTLRSMRATLAGNYALGEQLAQQTFLVRQQIQVENIDGIFGILMFTIRREQGELPQLLPVLQNFLEHNTDSAIWRPGLTLIYCDLNFVAEAQAQFELLATNEFATLPQDALWAGTLAYLSEVCTFLQDKERAYQIYQRLLPYAEHVLIVGFGVACLGAADHYLGLLATTLAQWDDAERHFVVALRLNAQIDAKPRLAHTQVQYAIMLLTRNQPGDRTDAIALLNDALDTIETFGMKFLAEKVEALRQRFFVSTS
jgi:DNA-binding SARP family transcriptional activator